MIAFLLFIVVLIFGCYLPIFTLFHDHSHRVSLAHVWMYIGVGIMSLGVLTICAKAAGIDMRMSILPGLILSIYALVKYRKRCWPVFQMPIWDRYTFLVVGIGGIYLLYFLVPGILMGTGKYPSMFFEFDIAYYLGHIHSLIRYDVWPPLSLFNEGLKINHHYGSQSSCAILSVLTGIAPHTCLLLIYMSLIALSSISTVWLILREQKTSEFRTFAWIGLLLLLFPAFYPIQQIFSILYRGTQNIRALGNLPYLFLDPDLFGFLSDFHQIPSSHTGIFCALILIYCLQNSMNLSRQRLAAFIVGVLFTFKAPYFLTVGMGFGLWMLWEILRTRHISFIFSPFIALCIAIGLYVITDPAQKYTFILAPGMFLRDTRFLNTLGTIILLGGVSFTVPHLKNILIKSQAWRYGFFIIPPLLLTNILANTVEGQLYNVDLFQLCTLLPLFLAMFVITLIKANWGAAYQQRKQKILLYLAVIVLICPFSHKVLQTFLLVMAPEHIRTEYIDNQTLAQALSTIPRENSLLVTNDFGYPPNNTQQDWHQVTLVSLFGHQTYAAHFRYENYPDAANRIALQQRFQKTQWDPELEELAVQLGWTHLVIYRPSPHPEHIPLPLIFENEEYQVYKFESREEG